jgi:Dos2-interacting transcription regulator of RNA-Pol-II
MASSENIVALYMASAEKEPEEEAANLTELSQRSPLNRDSPNDAGIQARRLKLLEFVRILGQYLTDDEPNTRKHGKSWFGSALMVALGCLSGVIASLPPKSLNLQEVDVMTTFFCDRLEDEVSTKENVMGLTALQDMSGFGEEEVTKVCNAYDPENCVC